MTNIDDKLYDYLPMIMMVKSSSSSSSLSSSSLNATIGRNICINELRFTLKIFRCGLNYRLEGTSMIKCIIIWVYS